MVQPHDDKAFNAQLLALDDEELFSLMHELVETGRQQIANGGTMEDGHVLRKQLLTEACIHARFGRMMVPYNEWKAARGL